MLCEESAPGKAGLLNLPGCGFDREQDRVVLNCATREAREEGGDDLIVRAIGGLGIYEYPNPDRHRLHLVFASVVESGEPSPSKEHPWAGYASFAQITKWDEEGRLRNPAVRRSIDFYRRGMIIPLEQFLTTVFEDKLRKI